jgi:hypothetical protein
MPEFTLSPLPGARARKATSASISSDDEATFARMIAAAHATGRLTTASDCTDECLRPDVAPPPVHRHMQIQSDQVLGSLPGTELLSSTMLALANECETRPTLADGSYERIFRVIYTGANLNLGNWVEYLCLCWLFWACM